MREMRELMRGGLAMAEAARRFNVSPTLVRLIRDGEIWKHVL